MNSKKKKKKKEMREGKRNIAITVIYLPNKCYASWVSNRISQNTESSRIISWVWNVNKKPT